MSCITCGLIPLNGWFSESLSSASARSNSDIIEAPYSWSSATGARVSVVRCSCEGVSAFIFDSGCGRVVVFGDGSLCSGSRCGVKEVVFRLRNGCGLDGGGGGKRASLDKLCKQFATANETTVEYRFIFIESKPSWDQRLDLSTFALLFARNLAIISSTLVSCSSENFEAESLTSACSPLSEEEKSIDGNDGNDGNDGREMACTGCATSNAAAVTESVKTSAGLTREVW